MQENYDVVVAGGGPAGIGAALCAARQGARTLLLEKNAYLGGSAASGLPFIDFFNKNGRQVVRGVAQELIEELEREQACIGHIRTAGGHLNSITMLDPEWVKITAERLLLEAGADILYHSFVCEATVEDHTLRTITVANKGGLTRLSAGCFIDCTGDGDIAAFGQMEYKKGRDSDHLMQVMSAVYRVVGVDVEKLSARFPESPIVAKPLGGDRTYNLHVSGRLSEWNDLLMESGVFDHPDHNIWAGTCREGELTYLNTVRVPILDPTDPVQLSKAEIEARRQLRGLMKFFNEHVPGMEKAYVAGSQNGIGIRETRRVIGEYILTGEDILEGRRFDDAIAQNGYVIDIHDPKGQGWKSSFIENEDSAYQIPYRCLVPISVDGLLVAGRCISTTHEALASTRIMPCCMALGQAAGTAAALACEKKVPPRAVDVPELQARLRKDGAVV